MNKTDNSWIHDAYVEANAYYELEHDVPLDKTTYEKLIALLAEADSGKFSEELQKNIISTLIAILVMYQAELPSARKWSDKTIAEYNETKNILFKQKKANQG